MMAKVEAITARLAVFCGAQTMAMDMCPSVTAEAMVVGSIRHPLANESIRTGGPRSGPPTTLACHPLLMDSPRIRSKAAVPGVVATPSTVVGMEVAVARPTVR